MYGLIIRQNLNGIGNKEHTYANLVLDNSSYIKTYFIEKAVLVRSFFLFSLNSAVRSAFPKQGSFSFVFRKNEDFRESVVPRVLENFSRAEER